MKSPRDVKHPHDAKNGREVSFGFAAPGADLTTKGDRLLAYRGCTLVAIGGGIALRGMIEIDGSSGQFVLIAYLVVGVVTFLAAFMPGNSPLYKVVSLILGAVMAVWAGQAMIFGGFVIINAFVLLAPAVLLLRGGIGWIVHAIRSSAKRDAAGYLPAGQLPAPRPHPAARQFGGPSAFAPQPPYSSGYATVHHAYPASPPADAAMAQSGQRYGYPVNADAARHAIPGLPEPVVPLPLSARAPRQRSGSETHPNARHRAG